MVRVVGTDPGTSGLDLLLLVDGVPVDQASLEPSTAPENLYRLDELLARWRPIDLIAGPSGYGLPLVRATDLTEADLDLMALVRPDERGRSVGIGGFRAWVRRFVSSDLPVLFLPGLIHLPTVPSHRKWNRIDIGTPDKLAVSALALRCHLDSTNGRVSEANFAVLEVGTAFTAILVIQNGELVDASAGTSGPMGLQSLGFWDGEAAYWRSPLSKADLFRGGLADLGENGPEAFGESIRKAVAGLRAVSTFDRVYLAGEGLRRPEVETLVLRALDGFATTHLLPRLPGASVKHAAQGAALLADGLAGGIHQDLVEALKIREASGTVLDWLRPPPTC